VRLVAVTCLPVRDEVIDYYLGLMPEAEKARARIELLSPEDASPRPLAEKILERADLMARLRQLVADRRARFVMPFNVRDAERDLALELAMSSPIEPTAARARSTCRPRRAARRHRPRRTLMLASRAGGSGIARL
jgi:Pre ATP-grasp domain